MTLTNQECGLTRSPARRMPTDGERVTSGLDVNSELQSIRKAIDAMDDDITALLARRADLSRRAQVVKRRAGLPIFNQDRETEIQGRYERAAAGSSSVAVAVLQWCRALARDDENGLGDTATQEDPRDEHPRDEVFAVLISNPA